ncbi:hypothetical protein CTRG_01200 [Candida tropicalis MYA-3404]|uniref:MIF4G domain-containing protein n=1 Tax=Candida tropicalis (strain ATCC MYA-3404 / T1) TaxID=294747 RepID=C5M5S0_CANTT|nr:hypothetical protein CTRG_01200 [Candida tropicalis MYA-3404]EER34340.1 hypothetical protein CTRG_01200 [Candida tropicalis MYA-3404]KAG4408208.1 hypothetical protein JTP64_001514 [Candida tropicalis]
MTAELDNRRKELLELNIKAWDGEHTFKTASKLDSSLKKNSTFIKKVKSITHESSKSILKDIETLSIEKYLYEVLSSLTEALIKVNKNDDVVASMEIISALHQRFTSQFSPVLLINLLVAIANPPKGTQEEDEKEVSSRISKQRNVLKLIMEFYLIGVFSNLKMCNKDIIPDEILLKFGKSASEPIIIVVIKDLLNYQLKSGNSLVIVQSYLKRFHHVIYQDDNDLLQFEVRNVLRQIFTIYTNATYDTLIGLKKKVHQISERNKKASIRTGRILDEIQTELDSTTKIYEKFKSAAEFLSPVVGIPLPKQLEENDEPEANEENSNVVEVVKTKSMNEDELNGVWEDIKEKNFYTVIPSLGELIEAHPQTEEESQSGSRDGEKIQEFLNKLDNINSYDLDQLVVEFNNLNLNNKATKNRIMKFFMEAFSINSLKYYTRFLKINEVNLSDLIAELITYLDKGFRSQLYQNKLNFKNILFFVEMIKFKMIPTHVIFHKIRNLTINITSTNNIDILSVFYEHVGRFLLYDPDYKDLMRQMIDLLKEKSKQPNLKINDKLAINNLLVTVEPPATKVKALQEKQQLSPRAQFIQRLIRVELDSSSKSLVIRLLRKIPMKQDDECCATLLDCFAHPEFLNYDNIPALATVLESYCEKFKKIVVYTVDTIIENIIRGLELNDYRMNRVRMSQVKFIAEMYNHKVINFKLVNDLLYRIICFGHPNNQPLPNNWDVDIDLPDNYFRIQLCCFLLSNLRSIFIDTDPPSRRKAATRAIEMKKRNDVNKELLGVFITFLQYYIFCKERPLPVELEFKLNDLFTKFKSIPTVKRYETIQEIGQRLSESIQSKQEAESYLENHDDVLNGDEDEDEEEDDYDDDEDSEGDDDEDSDDEEEDSDDDDSDNDDDDDSEDEEEEISSSEEIDDEESDVDNESEKIRLENDKKFMDDLDKEYERIMIESYSSTPTTMSKSIGGSNVRGGTGALGGRLSMPLPRQVLAENKRSSTLESANQENKVSFGLLTRNGKKNDVKQLHLPSDNKFAELVMKEKEHQRQDRQRIMNLVSNMQD